MIRPLRIKSVISRRGLTSAILLRSSIALSLLSKRKRRFYRTLLLYVSTSLTCIIR